MASELGNVVSFLPSALKSLCLFLLGDAVRKELLICLRLIDINKTLYTIACLEKSLYLILILKTDLICH